MIPGLRLQFILRHVGNGGFLGLNPKPPGLEDNAWLLLPRKSQKAVNIPLTSNDFLSKDVRDELDEQKRNLFETVFNDHKGTLKIKSLIVLH